VNQRISSRVGRMSSGFTLIELMIVVAIMAILAAIALPIYKDYVIRSKLTEAQNLLTDYRTKMEQYYQDNRSYANGKVCGAVLPVSPRNYFTYTCAITGAGQTATYVATATGIASQGTGNFVYTIDQLNTRQTTGVAPGWTKPTQNCWALRKSGECS
jgi:type IV pilus assembly protein PilE